ncbi:MAG TPA: hypothetical protein VFA56_07740 [Gaiellaceae bacterium]|nr:hypothetical protein [Gaiellaceae bacterium]
MPLFRRDHDEKTLNEQLLREAGLGDAQEPDPDPEAEAEAADDDEPEPGPQAIEIRPDAVVAVDVPGIAGASVGFVALPDGELIAEDDENADDDLSALADAVERELAPPYRVRGRRGDGDSWRLFAFRIDVRTFAFDGADELELVRRDGETTLRAGDEPVEARIDELERAGEEAGAGFVVHAERLDGDLWEVRAAPL